MNITKQEFIAKLYDIEEKHDLKLGREVQKVIRNEIIPMDVIKLINKYDNKFLTIYDTFNVIYKAKNKNPLYRNLRNKNLDINEKAIALSSLVTKILISYSKMKDLDDKMIFVKAMDVEGINNAINLFIYRNDTSELNNYSNQISDLLHLLYAD